MSEKKAVPVFYDESGNIISSSQTILRSKTEKASSEPPRRIITPPRRIDDDISIDVNDVSVMFNLSKLRSTAAFSSCCSNQLLSNLVAIKITILITSNIAKIFIHTVSIIIDHRKYRFVIFR